MFILTSPLSCLLISCQAGLFSKGVGGGNKPMVMALTVPPVPGASGGIDLNSEARGKFTKASKYGSPCDGKSAVGRCGNGTYVGTALAAAGLAAPAAPAAVGAGLLVVPDPAGAGVHASRSSGSPTAPTARPLVACSIN